MLSLSKHARGLCFVLLLAACSKGEDTKQPAAKPAAPAQDTAIRCALNGAKETKPDCTREFGEGPDGPIWIVHHPDGGFRRFVLIDKGTRIATADGADEVRAQRVGPDLEVRVAGERYLFPAAPEAAASGDAAKP